MAPSVCIIHYLLGTMIICSFVIAFSLAEGDIYEPELGPLGKQSETGESGEHSETIDSGGKQPDLAGEAKESGGTGPDKVEADSDEGADDNDPAHIVSHALLCFNEKKIYCNCDESYRLTIKGELHVPPEHVDEFCTGPCLEETNLVLHCIDGIMDRFLFFNKATTEDVKDTILAGCGHGDKRGDFNVAEHIKAEGGDESVGNKGATPVLLVILLTTLGHALLLSWMNV